MKDIVRKNRQLILPLYLKWKVKKKKQPKTSALLEKSGSSLSIRTKMKEKNKRSTMQEII